MKNNYYKDNAWQNRETFIINFMAVEATPELQNEERDSAQDCSVTGWG